MQQRATPLGVISAHGDCKDAVLLATSQGVAGGTLVLHGPAICYGWRLVDQLTVDGWHLNQLAAIVAADCMSLAFYLATGMPTGVKVQMASWDWVIVGVHG